MRIFFSLGLALIVGATQAQTRTKPTTATTSAAAPAAKANQPLAARLVGLLGLEAASTELIDRPLVLLLKNSAEAMKSSGVPTDQHQPLMIELAAQVKTVADELKPLVKSSAAKAAKETAQTLANNFSADELRQLIAYLESPLTQKLVKMTPELQAALNAHVLEDTRAAVTPKFSALQKALTARITAVRDAAVKAKK